MYVCMYICMYVCTHMCNAVSSWQWQLKLSSSFRKWLTVPRCGVVWFAHSNSMFGWFECLPLSQQSQGFTISQHSCHGGNCVYYCTHFALSYVCTLSLVWILCTILLTPNISCFCHHCVCLECVRRKPSIYDPPWAHQVSSHDASIGPWGGVLIAVEANGVGDNRHFLSLHELGIHY